MSGGSLPLLTPVLVARESEVETLVQSARARNARLALELRVALHEAETAEREAGVAADRGQGRDPLAAQETLRQAVEDRLAQRRLQLDAELDQAQAEAVQRVRAARIEAADIVAAAREELLAVLSPGTRWPAPPSPLGRVTPIEPFVDLASGGSAAASADDVPFPFWAPRSPQATQQVPRPPARLVAAATAAAATPGPAPVPAPPAATSPPPTAPALAPPQYTSNVETPTIRVSLDAPPKPRRASARQAPFRERYLHTDVMLPLLAVAIVVIVLVAWLA